MNAKWFSLFSAWAAGALLAGSAVAGTLVRFRIVGYSEEAVLEAELLDEEKPRTVAN